MDAPNRPFAACAAHSLPYEARTRSSRNWDLKSAAQDRGRGGVINHGQAQQQLVMGR